MRNKAQIIWCYRRKVLTLPHTLNMSASKVYKMLRSTDILNGYMIPCYDVLHTFGKEYIMDDLINLLKKRGALK